MVSGVISSDMIGSFFIYDGDDMKAHRKFKNHKKKSKKKKMSY
jgi:hypothetical protein